MSEQENFSNIINQNNSGKKYPAVKLVGDNPQLAAIVSKLVKPRDKSDFNVADSSTYYSLNQSQIEDISNTIKTNISDSENVLQLFPDIELAIQILVSSILSPKDMVKTDIIYKNSDFIMSSELTMKLNDIVKNTLTNQYKLNDKLQDMLRSMLFTTGSHIEAIIPESIVDEIINYNKTISTESLSELFDKDKVVNLGILGNPGEASKISALESLTMAGVDVSSYKQHIETDDSKLNKALESVMDVTDNYKLLKLPRVLKAANKNKVKNIVGRRTATEDNLTTAQLASTLYKDGRGKSEHFLVVPSRANSKRQSVDRPLVMKLPSESVIPVYVPGDETRHVGYFVLIDIDGNPVTTSSVDGCGEGLSSLTASNRTTDTDSISSLLIRKAKNNLTNTDSFPTLDQVTKVYGSIIEKDLMQRLKNGLYKSNIEISNNNDIYRIMLSRALSGHFTRILYLPEELVSYYAFKYHKNGVGKSFLDDIKILTSLRAIIMFSKVMAMTKNSIALTHVNMTLDPNDPDPQKTIEVATHEIAKTRQQYFPLGINSPVDLVDWIQRAGIEFSFEGHPGIPETKFEFETKSIQHEMPDSDLDELLRKQTYMAFGLSPEVVDNGFSGDFATTVVANNILLAKRIIQYQATFCKHLTDSAKKIILSDPLVLKEIKEAILENKDLFESSLSDDDKEIYKEKGDEFIDDTIERFVETIELELPKPAGATIENQVDAFDVYVDSLDKAIDAWISSEMVDSEIAGDISGNIDAIKEVVKNHFIRRWMTNNGFMPELADIVTSDADGNPSLDIYEISKGHLEGIIKSSIRFIESLNKTKKVGNRDLEKLDVEESEPTEDNTEETDTEEDTGDEEDTEEPEPTEDNTEEDTSGEDNAKETSGDKEDNADEESGQFDDDLSDFNFDENK